MRDKSTTGNQTTAIAGKATPGQEALITQSRSRTKRIKGLPSQFQVTLDSRTMNLKPVDTLRTLGFPEAFNRIWFVDKINHNAREAVTTLDCYSPIEVIDNTPEIPKGLTDAPDVPIVPGNWVYPASGSVTSLYGLRNIRVAGASQDHKGADIANGTDTPILAAADGTAQIIPGFNGGAGNMVIIRHGNGYVTRYFHNSAFTCTDGQQVRKGQQIAKMGTTGSSSGSHCHFEVFPPGVALTRGNQINPKVIFPKLGTIGATIAGGTSPD